MAPKEPIYGGQYEEKIQEDADLSRSMSEGAARELGSGNPELMSLFDQTYIRKGTTSAQILALALYTPLGIVIAFIRVLATVLLCLYANLSERFLPWKLTDRTLFRLICIIAGVYIRKVTGKPPTEKELAHSFIVSNHTMTGDPGVLYFLYHKNAKVVHKSNVGSFDIITRHKIKVGGDKNQATMDKARSLHWVLKISDRASSLAFFRDLLGMRVLRHEEFSSGCEAQCNGKYDGRWSKTMIGYGKEDDHFVFELTYNYGVKHYKLGNDLLYSTICSKEVFKKVAQSRGGVGEGEGEIRLVSPDGYNFRIKDESSKRGDPVTSVAVQVANLEKACAFWVDILKMRVLREARGDGEAVAALKCREDDEFALELVERKENQGKPIDHAEAYGRIAFACPKVMVPIMEEIVAQDGRGKVLTPMKSLETPGKSTVEVVILADPDGYEICLVGDEAFRELSVEDPSADGALEEAIQQDDSHEYFLKRAQQGKSP